MISKPRPSNPRPIATRVGRHLDRFLGQKVVDLSAIRQGRAVHERLSARALDPSALAELHPAHAAYVYVLTQTSILAEALTQLDTLGRISETVNRAHDDYVPSAPPMSPLTLSYFNTWTLFDCGAGIDRETIGTILLDLRHRLRMHAAFAALLEKWQRSRMGLYQLEEARGTHIRLRELVADERIEALNPTGYVGNIGSVWYVRALPPPSDDFHHHVVVTTPYEVTAPGVAGWMALLDRTLPKTRMADPKAAYEHLMKWGLEPTYWHEYVFEAYAGHVPEGIRLMGLPDVAESRPHSRLNENAERGPLRAYLASGRMTRGEPVG